MMCRLMCLMAGRSVGRQISLGLVSGDLNSSKRPPLASGVWPTLAHARRTLIRRSSTKSYAPRNRTVSLQRQFILATHSSIRSFCTITGHRDKKRSLPHSSIEHRSFPNFHPKHNFIYLIFKYFYLMRQKSRPELGNLR